MWVILGPFDGENGITDFEKPKLLKPNTTYGLGRKQQPLLVNSKKISQNHCVFVVGPHTVENTGDPNFQPSLQLQNQRPKGLRINRASGEVIEVQPQLEEPMEHGDTLTLISGILLRVEWRPIHIFSPPTRAKPALSKSTLEGCASLGIKVSQTMQEGITHHIAAHFAANLMMVASLLNLSRFVKLEWLTEVLRLGALSKDDEDSPGTSLEEHFVLPSETKYRPSFSPALLPKQKTFDIWEPNEERVNFFQPYRFICLHEKTTELESDVRQAINRGGGSFETFDIHLGLSKFHRVLSRGQAKEGKESVVVADVDTLQTAVGVKEWAEFVAKAKSFSSDIVTPARIVQSVIEVDVSLLKATAETSPRSSPLPEVVPNSIPEEPSMPPNVPTSPPKVVPLKRRPQATRKPSPPPPIAAESSVQPDKPTSPPKVVPLKRRPQGARERSTPPSIADTPVPEPISRPPLTRREHARQKSEQADTSSILDDIRASRMKSPAPVPAYVDLTAPAPPPIIGLKRRPRPGASGTQTLGTQIGETLEEPPLKKFKALFEASNPKGDIGPNFDEMQSGDSHSQSQTQTETQPRSERPIRSMGASSLAVLREEEEETQGTTATQQRGSKRRLETLDEDEEMQVDRPTEKPSSKRRAIEDVNAVRKTNDDGVLATATNKPTSTVKPPSTAKPPSTVRVASGKQGAPVGKPDTDDAFLKAIASTKRGKKTEDDFDREFNKLKIAKPVLERHDPEEEWAILKDFGDDSNIRGNFMTIVEMDVFKQPNAPKPSTSMNPAWVGLPNFKKFKHKTPSVPRPKVELVISQTNDYGIGPAYWKGGHSQTATQNNTFAADDSQMNTQFFADSQSQPQESNYPGRRQAPAADSDSDEVKAPVRRSRKPPSRSQTVAPTPKKAASAIKKKAPAKKAALFIDSDDDIQEMDEDNEDSRPKAGAASQMMDTDQTLPSSSEQKMVVEPATRKTTRPSTKAKKAPIIVDDDSDDGVVFKGFRGRRGK